jgi:4-hydroxy-3-methylbut-2-enyl diphosphate reductase
MTGAATQERPALKVLLCSPRGFCAGVVRAIDTVEQALARYGAPVYVRHEIVHNRYVVESLKAKGAIFVEELDEIPHTDAPVIFSAHGVPKSIPSEAQRRNLFALDATCPLVTKVHREAEIHHKRGREIVLIGHADHPEVVGTVGQLPPGAITLVQSVEEVARFLPRDSTRLAYVTRGFGGGGHRRLRRALCGEGRDRHHRRRRHVLPVAARVARTGGGGMSSGASRPELKHPRS